MGDDEEIVLLALEFEDDGFQTNGKIVVRLVLLVLQGRTRIYCYLPQRVDTCGGTGLARAW